MSLTDAGATGAGSHRSPAQAEVTRVGTGLVYLCLADCDTVPGW